MLPSPKIVKQNAARALNRGREPKKLITAYAGFTILIAALVTFSNFWLGHRIGDTGGLGQMGTRAIFSTAQMVLPILQSILLMCLELGYQHGIMRIVRGQYADHTDLKVGFQHFGPMLRMAILQGLLYFAVGMVTFYFSMQIYMITPWADELYAILAPYVSTSTLVTSTMVLDNATLAAATQAMLPMFFMYAALFGVLALILSYRFRMANFALLDNPKAGGLAALRASRSMMRGNALKLVKLDVSFWWFHGLTLLSLVLCYGDSLLAALGVRLPFNETVSFFLFYGAYLAVLFVIQYFLRNRLECAYVAAYEAICPKPKDSGVVLGNIFDM